MKTKLRYAHVADSNVRDVRETYSADTILSIGAKPLTPRERYAAENGGGQELSGNLTEGDLVALLAAIEQTAWVQWVKTRMAAEAPAGEAGGEVAGEMVEPTKYSAAEQRLLDSRQAFARARHPRAESMHYAKPKHDPALDRSEQYERRAAAHMDLASAADDYQQSRKEVADRAMAHAMRFGTSYEEGLIAVRGSEPMGLVSASPY